MLQNTPIESLETHYPFIVRETSLRRGSGGNGMRRGGDGIVRELEFTADVTVSIMAERRRNAPWGLAGGQPGATGEDWVIRRNGTRERLPGKVTFEAAAGERLRVATPGGGGWGPA